MIRAKKFTALVGQGLYTPRDAARLSRIPVARLNHWIGERKGIPPVIHRRLKRERLLTFQELMEIQFIELFRREGLSLQSIRKAAEKAAAKFGSEYPFSIKRFDTDGKEIFATLIDEEHDRVIVEELRRGQLVFEPIIRPFFRKLDFRGQRTVERYWPCDRDGRVVLDPSRHFGQPIDAETGVATRSIRLALAAGGGQEAHVVAEWLNIPLEAVKAAASFEQSLDSEVSVRQ